MLLEELKHWFVGAVALLLPIALMPVARAAYVVAPDIAQEYISLRAAVHAHPDDPDLNFRYAICLSYVGKVEEGRAVLKQVKKLDADFAKTALPRYLRQLAEHPHDVKTKYRLGFLYYFNDQYDQALKIFDEVARQQPVGQLNAWALGYMGAIKGDQKKWGEGEKLVREALAIEPDAYGLHAALAAALKGQGRYLAAMGEFITALNKRSEFQNYERERFPAETR
jgi:tetratricopeptide (TPR) repeat protein